MRSDHPLSEGSPYLEDLAARDVGLEIEASYTRDHNMKACILAAAAAE